MATKPLFTIEGVRVYGNNHNVPLVYWHELTQKEQERFDYLDNPEDNFTGFRYKGNVYGLDEFPRVESYHPFKGHFDAYMNDTFFSGIGIKLTDDSDFIKVYTFYSG